MSEVNGTVVKSNENSLLIEIKRDACSTCAQHSHCRIVEKNESYFVSVDKAFSNNAQVGDEVLLETGVSRIIGLSLLLYIFPVFSVLGFTILGIHLTGDETKGMIAGMAGGLIAFLIIYIIDRKIGKKLKHKITRVLK